MRAARSTPFESDSTNMTNSTTIAVVGLGYVGLPLAVEFGKHYRTIGFDLSQAKIDAFNVPKALTTIAAAASTAAVVPQ